MGTDLNSINASSFVSGVVSTARMGSGIADSTTFLRGDGTWHTIMVAPAGLDPQIQYNAGGVLAGSSNLTFDTSTGTLTATNLAGNASSVQQLNASNLSTGIVPAACLGSGTANTSTFLRGDQTWQVQPLTPPGGPTGAVQFNSNGVLGGNSNFTSSPVGGYPNVKAKGTWDVKPTIPNPSVRFRDAGSNIKGGFTYYGTPFGTLAVPCACGRLTLDPNHPASAADIGLTSTIYYLPCNGNQITLWNVTFGDFENVDIPDGGWSLDISALGSGSMYDLYIQNNQDGTAQLVYGTRWANTTTRAAQDTITAGMVLCYNNQRLRYVGTVYIQNAGQTQDSGGMRALWNAYNQVPRKLKFSNYNPGGGYWTFVNPNTGTVVYRAANNDNNGTRLLFVMGGVNKVGMAGAQFVLLDNSALYYLSVSGAVSCGVALDQLTLSSYSNDMTSQTNTIQSSTLKNRYVISNNIGPGLHWFTMGEAFSNNSGASATINFYTGSTGMIGWVMA